MKAFRAAAVLALFIGWSGFARAADIRVIYPSALAPALDALLPQFERATGGRALVEHGGLGVISERSRGGGGFDVVITSAAQIEALAARGDIVPGPRAPIARGAIGVGTRTDFPSPKIAALDDFKSAMTAAKSIAYVDPATGSAVGAWLTNVFEKQGLAAALKPKTILASSAAALFEAVKSGRADFALAQMSEISADPALKLAGALPVEIQNVTPFAAGTTRASAQAGAAKSLIDFLASPAAAAVFKAKGLGVD